MAEQGPVPVGVIGVGSMGSNHARVYHELPEISLVGVADADRAQAEAIADQFGTRSVDTGGLLDRAEAVSIATPTRYHFEVAAAAIDRGVHVLVEKPFVADVEQGRTLIDRAADRGLALQVGHVERFNPAVQAAIEIAADLDLVAIDARRLGPPIDRGIGDGVVMDLMIHDIDVTLALVDDGIDWIGAAGASGGKFVDATLRFDGGVVGSLTASRITQRRVRRLSLTAENCQVEIDYIAQSVKVHRHSLPEYIEADGDVRYRHERVTEYPSVERGEPLKRELAAFVEAVRTGADPIVDGRAGLEAVETARRIAARSEHPADVVEATVP